MLTTTELKNLQDKQQRKKVLNQLNSKRDKYIIHYLEDKKTLAGVYSKVYKVTDKFIYLSQYNSRSKTFEENSRLDKIEKDFIISKLIYGTDKLVSKEEISKLIEIKE